MSDGPDIFNRYDIRGDYPEEIDEEFALRFGKSLGEYIRKKELRKRVILGYDTRKSSLPLKKSIASGLTSLGIDVLDVGVGPTDKVALLGKMEGCGLSVMVTASHHDWKRNGIKLLYEEGNGFSNEDLEDVRGIYMEGGFNSYEKGEYEVMDESDGRYLKRAVEVFGKYFDGIEAKVIFDGCNGGSFRLGAELLRRLGADVVEINTDRYPDEELEPKPNEGSRSYLKKLVVDHGADIAVGCDPDADRVFVVDRNGEWIDGDVLFALLVKIIKPKTIAASLDTSKLVEEILKGDVYYTRVGDIFVSRKGRVVGAQLIGEPNGHYAIPEFTWYNSGVFCSALFAALGKKIHEEIKNLPEYYTENFVIKTTDNDEKAESMKKIKKAVESEFEVLSKLDGVKFSVGGCTCLARPSGTSPKIRVKVEGKDRSEVEKTKKMLEELF